VRRVLPACAVLACTLSLVSQPLPCTAAEPAGDAAAFGELLKLLAARQHGHVTFTEVQQLSILDQPLHSSGELLYDAPNRLEKRTLEPRSEDLLLENGVLTVERNHHRRSVALRDFPQAAPFVESVRATLAGDRAALEHYFTVHFSGNLDRWSVEVHQSDGDSSTLTIGPELTP